MGAEGRCNSVRCTHGWRNIPISNNVGGVKHFSSTPRHALEEERHFALVEAFAFALPTKARSQSVSVRNSVRPIHLFDRNFDHDSYFELPCEGGAGCPIITSVITAHHGDVRALPRANRTSSSARSPIPCATSSTCAPPVSGPSPPWRSSVLAASPGGNTYSAI